MTNEETSMESCVTSVNMSRYAVPVSYLYAKSELHDLLQDEYRFEVSQGNSFQRLKAIKFKRSAMTDTKA